MWLRPSSKGNHYSTAASKESAGGGGRQAGKEAERGGCNETHNYSDLVVANALKEAANHYNKTDRYLTHEDAMLSDQPLLSLPRGTVCLVAAKALQQSVQTNGTKPPA